MTNLMGSAQRLVDDAGPIDPGGRLGARSAPTAEWLSGHKTADDELALLNRAAARIRSARILAQQNAHNANTLKPASMAGAELWECVVSHAAREAACASAQLAHIGLDIGSIAVVRRGVDSKNVRSLALLFRDGDEVRPPGLMVTGLRDGRIHYEWSYGELASGELDLSIELGPQLRWLVLRLCNLVAQGYADEVAGRPSQTPGVDRDAGGAAG